MCVNASVGDAFFEIHIIWIIIEQIRPWVEMLSIPKKINLPSPTSSGDFFFSFKTNAAGRLWGQINFLGNAYTSYSVWYELR